MTTLPDHNQTKALEALQRAVPITRMVDYGVPLPLATTWHQAIAMAPWPAWDEVGEALAAVQRTLAQEAAAAGNIPQSSVNWLACHALLQCAHLAFNQDTSRKRELLESAQDALLQHARLNDDLEPLTIPVQEGSLHGWLVSPATPAPHSGVVIVGGLSGWGGVYLEMARALTAKGIAVVLAEGPGQGLTRVRHGITLDSSSLPLFRCFVDALSGLGAKSLGVWGNSFGGLLAAHIAIADSRIAAVCINGAPLQVEVPTFRTAQEQMAALCGACTLEQTHERMTALSLLPMQHRIAAAMLILEGGQDPLIPLGSQADFLQLSHHSERRLLSWPDGEHTLYNHANERNAQVAEWFVQQLAA